VRVSQLRNFGSKASVNMMQGLPQGKLSGTAGSRKAVTCIFRNCARTTSCTRRNGTHTFILNKYYKNL